MASLRTLGAGVVLMSVAAAVVAVCHGCGGCHAKAGKREHEVAD